MVSSLQNLISSGKVIEAKHLHYYKATEGDYQHRTLTKITESEYEEAVEKYRAWFETPEEEEGQKDAEVVLLTHGEPSWSFLYRKMIPILVKAGFRVLAPDLVGFGKSDKPTQQTDHTYHKHVDWMTNWMIHLDLKRITLFCQRLGVINWTKNGN